MLGRPLQITSASQLFLEAVPLHPCLAQITYGRRRSMLPSFPKQENSACSEIIWQHPAGAGLFAPSCRSGGCPAYQQAHKGHFGPECQVRCLVIHFQVLHRDLRAANLLLQGGHWKACAVHEGSDRSGPVALTLHFCISSLFAEPAMCSLPPR